MVIYKKKPKKEYQDDEIKTVVKYALFPKWLVTSQMPSEGICSHLPSYVKTELIWFEKYVETYTYWAAQKEWVLRKSERLGSCVLERLANDN